MSNCCILVVSPVDPQSLPVDDKGNVIVSEAERLLDATDEFNHPRLRRALILQQLLKMKDEDSSEGITFQVTDSMESWTELYKDVHSKDILDFLSTAWDSWTALGGEGADLPGRKTKSGYLMVPINVPLHRNATKYQRASKHVLGKMGYYCTDFATPIFERLTAELARDAAAVQAGVDAASSSRTVYILPTHPGHHASQDSFGGYCYVNGVAAAARRFQTKHGYARVAILDVDYHAGNGTASIFYEDPTVLVVSLHCDPDWDYPFHSGFAEETGQGKGAGNTLHLPMPPGTTWETYQASLQKGLQAINQFSPGAVLVSLGLDTYHKDPCALRGAGFKLQGDDYKSLGRWIAEKVPPRVPVVFMQEGGYRMEKVGEAASDVVTSFCQNRSVA